MVEQHFCLRWNNYRTNITAEFEVLREGQHFVDVTLACDGHQLKAHKVVLSACSPYFKELLQGNPCSHPIIILRDVAFLHMRGLLEFMYAGEVNVSQAHLAAFLRTAEALKIRGLAEAPAPDHQAVAAAAAAAVTNSMADLLALKSSIGSLPLVPLASPIAQPPPPPSTLSDAKNIPPIHLSNKSGLLSNLSELSNENIDKRDIKVDLCSEPLPLTVNNNIQPKDLRSPSPHQRNKRLKCSHGGSGESSAPSSPQSYYPSNTPHSNGSATGDIPGEDIAHDLSSNKMHHHHLSEAGNGGGGGGGNIKRRSSSASSANCNNSSTTTAAAASCGVNTQVSSVSVASLPPSLVTSSPDHMQYAVKSEPLDGCGGGSDTEGGCGGSWHEDSVGSDGECSNVKAMDALPPHARAGGSTTPVSRSATTTQHSPMPPVSAQQQHQQISPPPHAASHLMHTSSVQQHQESHLAGIMRSFEPLPCPICKRSYSSPGNLKQHIENIHMATTEPNFECRICNNKFKSKWYLHKHLHRAHHIRGRKEP